MFQVLGFGFVGWVETHGRASVLSVSGFKFQVSGFRFVGCPCLNSVDLFYLFFNYVMYMLTFSFLLTFFFLLTTHVFVNNPLLISSINSRGLCPPNDL